MTILFLSLFKMYIIFTIYFKRYFPYCSSTF